MNDAADGGGEGVVGENAAGEHGADEGADAPEDESDEALGGAADSLVGFLVDVELAGDEEEVVADAVEEDGGEDEEGLDGPDVGAGADGEEQVTGCPGDDSDHDGFLVAEVLEHDGQEEEEYDIGDLSEGHLGGHVGPTE